MIPPSASTDSTPVPTLSSTPVPTPAGNEANGTAIAQRILDRHPKLKVLALTDAPAVQKLDGVELAWVSPGVPAMVFLIPEEDWSALTPMERYDLQAYVASRLTEARTHPERYMYLLPGSPNYRNELGYLRHITNGSWYISSTQSYPDDPEVNLYPKSKLALGPDVPR